MNETGAANGGVASAAASKTMASSASTATRGAIEQAFAAEVADELALVDRSTSNAHLSNEAFAAAGTERGSSVAAVDNSLQIEINGKEYWAG